MEILVLEGKGDGGKKKKFKKSCIFLNQDFHFILTSIRKQNGGRMMRKPRVLREHAMYHVIARTNRKEMSLNSSYIKEVFLQVLRKAKTKYKFFIHNFCIMGNHIHLIIQPDEKENLSKIMQWILSVFAKRFNKIFDIIGHVWYDRFLSKIIKTFRQYLITFIYIARNPVKAKIVTNASDYKYSGVYQIHKGIQDILERPPTSFMRIAWREIVK